MMHGSQPPPASSSGSAARENSQHYLVFSPGTTAPGLEITTLAAVPLSDALRAFESGATNTLHFIVRLADPAILFSHPDLPLWRCLVVTPDRATFAKTTEWEASFSGAAEDPQDVATVFACTVTLQVHNHPSPPQTRIGELTLTQRR